MENEALRTDFAKTVIGRDRMKDNVLERIAGQDFGGNRPNTLVTYLNPYSYLIAREHFGPFGQFDEIRIDGIALVFFLKLFNIAAFARRSFDMTSDAAEVFAEAAGKGKSVYLIGAEPEEMARAVQRISARFPQLKIAGFRGGYFKDEMQRQEVLDALAETSPDYVICGMGAPYQERFLVDLRQAGWQGTGYTCGGFFHQSAERLDYYPKWIDKLHFRWLYRIYKEPKLARRYGWEYPKFVWFFLTDYRNFRRQRRED